jgi:hypothetical protein
MNDYVPYLTINYEILEFISKYCSENISLQNKIIELNLFNNELIKLIVSKYYSDTKNLLN